MQALAALALALLVCLAASPESFGQEGGGLSRIGAPPGGTVTATGPDGERTDQQVGQAQVDLALALDGPEEAEMGSFYRLTVIVHNNSDRTARDVRVRISVAHRDTSGAEVETLGAIRFAGSRPVRCVARAGWVCPFGNVPPGQSRSVELRAETRSTVPPGQIVFSAELRAGSRSQSPGAVTARKEVALVPRAPLRPDVNLRLAIERDSDVVQRGMRFGHVITVRNVSDRDAATDVELQIRQRLGVREGGRITEVNDALRSSLTALRQRSCTRTDHHHLCRFPRIGPRGEIRVSVELSVVEELLPGSLGRVQTQARVRSAENDPDLTDNFASEYTTVASRLPEIAFFRRVENDRGEVGVRPTETVTHGQWFAVAARFLDVPGGQPWSADIPVRLVVPGGDTIEVSLQRASAEPGSDYRLYRSPLLRLLAPGMPPPPDTDASRVIYARSDTRLRAVYGAGGATPAEATVTVRAQEGPR